MVLMAVKREHRLFVTRYSFESLAYADRFMEKTEISTRLSRSRLEEFEFHGFDKSGFERPSLN
jgi:hypothetical protein